MSKSKKTDSTKTEDPSIHILSFNFFKMNKDNMDESQRIVFYVDVPEIKTLGDFNKCYTGSIAQSLDTMHLKTIYPDMVKTIKLNSRTKKEVIKQFSDSIINLSFDYPIRSVKSTQKSYCIQEKKNHAILVEKPYAIDKIEINLKELRNLIYNTGINIVFNYKNKTETVHYVHYKRSSSKVKNGDCLFIREDLYDKMIAWSHLDLPNPQDKIDLASVKAYESLVCSGLEHEGQRTVKISAKNILLVNDLLGDIFEAYQSVTYRDGKEIRCENLWREVQNTCSDGECLLDESLFETYNEAGHKHGFMLLRQRFFKSAALNTKVVGFLKSYFGSDYDTVYIQDKFGRDVKVSDIRMIVCPSSLKLLKLYQIWFKSEQECYEHWLKKLDEEQGTFGIVKHEKPSPFGFNTNQLSYQIINTLPLDHDGVRKLLDYEFEYVNRLKNDIKEFLNHINADSDDETEKEEITSSRDFINAMIKLEPEFYRTKLFKDFRHDTIENYRKVLRKGKIKTQCDYAVQFGNPWELLLSTVKEITPSDVVASGRECYCPRFYVPNRGLAIFRSPHISTGNVMYAINVCHEEYKWFNLTDNIVLINAWDNDWFDRTQGSDCDSDQLVLVSNEQIAAIAKECDIIPEKGSESSCLYPTPVNAISGDKTLRKYTLSNMAEIDYIISENNIGRVVNTSQLLNSYYWHIKATQPEEKELLEEIYKNASICSSLSQVEIDKAKKMYKNLAVKRILSEMLKLEDSNGYRLMQLSDRKVEKTYFNEDEAQWIIDTQTEQYGALKERVSEKGSKYTDINKPTLKKMPDSMKYKKFKLPDDSEVDFVTKLVKPNFFKYCSSDKNVDFQSFETPMDYLEEILSDEFPRVNQGNSIKTVDIMDLLTGKGKVNDGQLKTIYETVFNAKSQISATYAEYGNIANDEDQKQEREKKLNSIRQEAILELNKMKIKPATVYYILAKIYGTTPKDDEWSQKLKKIALTLVGMLYQAQPKLMQSLFINNKESEENQYKIAI